MVDLSPHQFHPSILREYDVRGVYGSTLNSQDALALGAAYGTTIRRNGGHTVCLGYDGRSSSPSLCTKFVEGVRSTGVDVRQLGLVATPIVYFAVHQLDLDGGVMITGSHNGPEYNGFKMMVGKSMCFGEAIAELGRLAAKADFETGAGETEATDILSAYIQRIVRDAGKREYRIAWDPANGALGPAVEALVKLLPGEHFIINADVDGSFPNHPADPTVEENLTQLKTLVADKRCDIGISFDGDGDRIGVVDTKGRVVWSDQIMMILCREILARHEGSAIVADVKCSELLFSEIERLGGCPVMSPSGHSVIKDTMVKENAPLAGELSGHIFFKDGFYGHDDALYAAIRLLAAVEEQGGDLARLVDLMPKKHSTPEVRIFCEEDRKFRVVSELQQIAQAEGLEYSDLDGIRATTDNGWWLIRASNTQPALVIRCESSSEAGLGQLREHVSKLLKRVGIDAISQL